MIEMQKANEQNREMVYAACELSTSLEGIYDEFITPFCKSALAVGYWYGP